MPRYLLDTNVLSEIRKGRRAAQSVRGWFDNIHPADLFVSVVSLGEIRKGIELVRPRDPDKATALEAWLHDLEGTFSEHLFPITPEIADRWGVIAAARPIPAIDGYLAATALTHNLTLATWNTADFGDTGLSICNPFDTRV